MNPTRQARCPYLGLTDDPETRLTFPSLRNACHRATPHEPVQLNHQSAFCLSGMHLQCPVYRGGSQAPLPVELRAYAPTHNWRNLAIGALVFIAALTALTFFWIQTQLSARSSPATGLPLTQEKPLASRTATPSPFAPVAGTKTAAATTIQPFATETTAPSASATNLPPPSATVENILPTLAPTTQCAHPAGWVLYTVLEGDTLFSIGLAYGITVSTLQAANCMGATTFIAVGQQIYVPNVRLSTATPAHTTMPPTLPAATETQVVMATPTATQPLPSATPSLIPTASQPPPSPTTAPPAPTATPEPLFTPTLHVPDQP